MSIIVQAHGLPFCPSVSRPLRSSSSSQVCIINPATEYRAPQPTVVVPSIGYGPDPETSAKARVTPIPRHGQRRWRHSAAGLPHLRGPCPASPGRTLRSVAVCCLVQSVLCTRPTADSIQRPAALQFVRLRTGSILSSPLPRAKFTMHPPSIGKTNARPLLSATVQSSP